MPTTQARDDDWFETDVPAHAAARLPEETGAHVAQTIGPAGDGCRTIVLTIDADAPSAGRDASILDGGLDTHWVVPERRDRRFDRLPVPATGRTAADPLVDDEPEPITSRVPRTARRPARERAAVRWSAQDAPLQRSPAPGRARTEDVVVQGTWTAATSDEALVAFDAPAADEAPLPVAWFGETAADAERDARLAEDAVAVAVAVAEAAADAVTTAEPAEQRTTSSWFAQAPTAADLPEGPVSSTTPAVPSAPRRRSRRPTGGLARRSSGPVGGVPGRRTVEIAGTPTIPGTPRLVAPERRRVAMRSPMASLAERPDRIALWAVLLGVFLILVAATSGHAAGF